MMLNALVPAASLTDLPDLSAHLAGARAAPAPARPLVAPGSRDALYWRAINERRTGRLPEALASLRELEVSHPQFGRLHEERGHCLLALGDGTGALQAYGRAVQRNPALAASWSALQGLYTQTGDTAQAAAAAGQHALLQALPGAVVQAGSHFCEGDVRLAEVLLRRFVQIAGPHSEALRLLARIAWQRGALEQAQTLFAEVLALAPGYRAARLDYGRFLIERPRYHDAAQVLAPLLRQTPDDAEALRLSATAAVGLGDHEAALAWYRRLLQLTPAAAELQVLLAHSLKALGQTELAIESYQAAARLRPDFGDAYWSLANLKTYRFCGGQIDAMRSREADPRTTLVDRWHLCFALGKALEDQGDYALSWRYYLRGNALKRAQLGYWTDAPQARVRQVQERFDAAFFRAHAGGGAAQRDPIFVVGMPRSGSTLVEQILASHTQIEACGELAELPLIAAALQGRAALPHEAQPAPAAGDWRRWGERYLEQSRVYRHTKRAFFIDKLPNNFWHMGLIHAMLPEAIVIDVRREPMACCWSNLKQLYAAGQEFSYSMQDVAHYYRAYLELMRHWDRVLPGRVLHVSYEGLVADLTGTVRRLLEHCALPFEPGCLDFHRTRRIVHTPSSEQVRQPLFRHGLEPWRNFEPWLGPLKHALGDALSDYRL